MTRPKPNHDSDLQSPVVMVVDDEEMVVQTLKAFLELETKYCVRTFLSPVKALESLKESPVDLIISDFLMPEMDGLEFLAQVKKMYPDVPRILLTGYADKENAIKAINEIGLYQYVEKPWDNENLRLIIRNGIAQKSLNMAIQKKIRELDQAIMRIDELAQRNEILQDELLLARRVQQSLFPKKLPDIGGLRLSVRYQPALEVGGDFYDVIPLAGDRLAVLIADITGHGIQAALSTVLLKLAFSSHEDQDAGPGEIIESMNDTLFRGLPSGIFVAALVLVVDPETGKMVLASGGIPYPMLLDHKSGSVQRIAVNGLVLGLVDSDKYKAGDEVSLLLQPGNSMILYTDGLSEIHNDSLEAFESNLMSEVIARDVKSPASKILNELFMAAKQFSASDHKWDDITIVGIERN